MPRPFRFEPPRERPGSLARPALDELLARRWDVRVLTVVAGAGFGKTTTLAGMVGGGGRGRHHWLTCVRADHEPDHLLRGLTEACGRPGASLDDLVEHLWAVAPDQVCLVLDDVHELAARSAGAELLAELLAVLPANVHVVLAGRGAVPLPTGRLAAAGQLVRLGEDELRFDDDELSVLAERHGVAFDLLAATGGWPALVELTLSAGSDLVLTYLWEEILSGLGDRARLLARFGVVGGGGDDIASAVAGRPYHVDELVAGVPLVSRTADGGAVLHPLWSPALARAIGPDEGDEARVLAAAAHREAGRASDAIELFAQAGCWDEVLAVMRSVAIDPGSVVGEIDHGAWFRRLPVEHREHPAARLSRGIDRRTRAIPDAVADWRAAASGFAAAGDLDGELAAINEHGSVAWLTHDLGDLAELVARVDQLAAAGSDRARNLQRIGRAGVAHLAGDSAGVIDALSGLDPLALPHWGPTIAWLLAVAYRRSGDLERATALAEDRPAGGWPNEIDFEQARLRLAWLAGDVDATIRGLAELQQTCRAVGDEVNATGAAIELATRQAWVGDAAGAEATLGTGLEPILDGTPMGTTMSAMALAAVAIAQGDEERAASVLARTAGGMIGRPEGWYWRDRAGIALVHVLVPSTRAAWADEPLGEPHRHGIALAEVVEAVRAGDLDRVASMRWPAPGIVRCHLPVPWIAEVVAAADAVGVSPPQDLVDQVGPPLRAALLDLAERSDGAVARSASRMAATLPSIPRHRLAIEVLGPVAVRRDGRLAEEPEIRRRRVRELLCLLAVERRIRREVATDRLWPDLDDGGRNLRVTLNYLQRVVEPARGRNEPPYFVRSDGTWITVAARDTLDVDLWRLEELFDRAEAADAQGQTRDALRALLEALPLLDGEAFPDVAYAEWIEPVRRRVTERYVRAALRAAELQLARGDTEGARRSAQRALGVDRFAVAAHDVIVRAHRSDGDSAAAQEVERRRRLVLDELGVGDRG